MSTGDCTDLKKDSRGRGSWKKDSPPALRRPYTVEPPSAREPKATVAPIVSSSLSADAKEWYPPNYSPASFPQQNVQSAQNYNGMSTAQRYSVQSRLRGNQSQENFQNVNNSSYVSEECQIGVNNHHIIPAYNGPPRSSVQDRLRVNRSQNNFESIAQTNFGADDDDEDEVLMESIHHLITVMCQVTFSPGSFDGLCGPLVDTFASTLDDPHYTQPLVDAIVNQSISEPNFRYNGARLCTMYDSLAADSLAANGESVFRNCLLERCAADEEKIINGSETSEYMRGFAMFLAELYTQLENPEGGRIRSLGERLCKMLLYLLGSGDGDCIKSVCQILKLSGLALDADCPTEVDLMFVQLRRLAEMNTDDQNSSLAFLIRNIINLRIGRWLTSVVPEAQKDIEIIPNGATNSSSFRDPIYMPDGLKLTAEESEFLQTHADKSDEDDEPQENFDNEAWDTDMDAEMRAGFVEFLKLSNQIKR